MGSFYAGNDPFREEKEGMKMGKRRRTIDPAKAAAAAGGDPGWYRSIPVPVHECYCCGRCGTSSVTVRVRPMRRTGTTDLLQQDAT